jgi:hypothetical protein
MHILLLALTLPALNGSKTRLLGLCLSMVKAAEWKLSTREQGMWEIWAFVRAGHNMLTELDLSWADSLPDSELEVQPEHCHVGPISIPKWAFGLTCGSERFERVLKLSSIGEPQTELHVQSSAQPELWTGLGSSSLGFRFEPKFGTELRQHYSREDSNKINRRATTSRDIR